ncbi:2Fe-2S iron-sulfur cluster-binding protein [Cesiribacter sp. SM1]|uniref:2Fe-2S iron-sulfur cluster-binding protein n=1 Tax=Cesiribacter sp. SM1 TaxID=2861196 RepID=UPI001CD4EABF|nr:2Fe-2S iron-sulfur cluster-binding protein [Cesiribacter sp. SM1]
MPSITIQNLDNKTVEVTEMIQSVLQAMGAAGVDWMHACGGKGRCTTCAMKVVEGAENLSTYTEAEQRMQRQGRLPKVYRLACQCIVEKGRVVVRVPESGKLPHLEYTD